MGKNQGYPGPPTSSSQSYLYLCLAPLPPLLFLPALYISLHAGRRHRRRRTCAGNTRDQRDDDPSISAQLLLGTRPPCDNTQLVPQPKLLQPTFRTLVLRTLNLFRLRPPSSPPTFLRLLVSRHGRVRAIPNPAHAARYQPVAHSFRKWQRERLLHPFRRPPHEQQPRSRFAPSNRRERQQLGLR